MDAYPEDYVTHNSPLVLLSGIDADHETSSDDAEDLFQGRGTQIECDLPPVTGVAAENLRLAFLAHDASNAPWSAWARAQQSGIGWRVRFVGRVSCCPTAGSTLTSLMGQMLHSLSICRLEKPTCRRRHRRAQARVFLSRIRPSHR